MKVHAPQKLSLETKSLGEITPEKKYGIERLIAPKFCFNN